MVNKLGNSLALLGLLGLVIFFTSSSFFVDQGWFLLGGVVFLTLGISLRRRKKEARKTKKRARSHRRRGREEDDQSP